MLPSRTSFSPTYLLLVWLFVNLLQAAITPLDPDETYYWMYAGQLDWGYFDHPPAVAVLIKLGMDWLPGALGLRLGHVLVGTATVAVLYHLLDRPRGKQLLLAAGLIAAQPMLQVYGFIATPDAPLLLFTALYLLVYRRFLRAPTLPLGMLWGMTMAGLLYSKYHGVMLIFFSVLPNLGFLLRQPGAWLAAGSGATLFAPHLYWQYLHDYPSFRYHLSGRDDPYRVSFTLHYLINQLLIFSPLLAAHYVLAFRRDRARDAFERACRWLVAGFLLFFLYTTTKGSTEAQWTALLSIPLVYVLYHAALRFPGWQPRLRKLAWATVVLLLLARIVLLLPRGWLPFAKPFDHAPWVERLATLAGDRPVVIENSYRLASLYAFYSGGKPAWTFTDVEYRPSQYDLWPDDSAFHDRTVLLLGQADWQTEGARPFATQKRNMLLKEVPDFQVAKHVRLTVSGPLPLSIRAGDRTNLTLSARSPRAIDMRAALPLDLFAILQYPGGEQVYWKLAPLRHSFISAGGARGAAESPTQPERVLYEGPLTIPPTAPAGEVDLEFGLGYRGMPPLRGQSAPLGWTILPSTE